jgi:cephalosporin hydroxylase
MDELSLLADEFGCEKYHLCDITKYYDKILSPFRDKEFNLLEIGVYHGSSMRMWESYFTKVNIYGIDITIDSLKHSSDRVHCMLINQSDVYKLSELAHYVGKFFLICDDGSHHGEDVINSLNVLHPFLEVGGFYFIEDIQPKFKDMIEKHLDTLPLKKISYHTSKHAPEEGLWILQK